MLFSPQIQARSQRYICTWLWRVETRKWSSNFLNEVSLICTKKWVVHTAEQHLCFVNGDSSYFFMVVSANVEQLMLWKIIQWIMYFWSAMTKLDILYAVHTFHPFFTPLCHLLSPCNMLELMNNTYFIDRFDVVTSLIASLNSHLFCWFWIFWKCRIPIQCVYEQCNSNKPNTL